MDLKKKSINELKNLIGQSVSTNGWLDQVRGQLFQLASIYGKNAAAACKEMGLVPGARLHEWQRETLQEFVSLIIWHDSWDTAYVGACLDYSNRKMLHAIATPPTP